ncbi:MAG: hypothetical protein ACKO2G_06610 [Verrucomicrobiales bacterium]
MRHEDAGHEFHHERQNHLRKLARGLDEAPARGWHLVSMKNDWKVIFPAP